MKSTTSSIVIKVEPIFNGNLNSFYDELYKNRITYGFIRSELGLSENIKIKLNGGFTRDLYYLDEQSHVQKIRFRIQTAAWRYRASGKWNYISIFPCFIKRYCSMSLHMLEKVSCQTGKGENVFWHIDDPEELFDCEDPIVRPLVRFEKEFKVSDPSALLNSRYVQVFNRPIVINTYGVEQKRFKKVYEHTIFCFYLKNWSTQNFDYRRTFCSCLFLTIPLLFILSNLLTKSLSGNMICLLEIQLFHLFRQLKQSIFHTKLLHIRIYKICCSYGFPFN
jgi:hypothetical protein